jgi:glycosyltransferase involved in cell wall biosynthesis
LALGRIMKVLHLTKFYPPHMGGIESVTRDLADAQRRAGCDVRVLCANKGWETVDDVDPVGVPVTRAGSWGMLQSTSMCPGMVRLLREKLQDVDLLHVHMPDPMAAAAVWAVKPTCPLVLQWHSDVVRQRLMRHVYQPLERWMLQRADAVIATSDAYADSSSTLLPWRPKVQVVPLGVNPPQPVDLRLVDEIRHRHGERRIVFALGRLTYYKGYDVLLQAVRHLPDDVVVVVAGGGSDLARWRDRVRLERLEHKLRFHGYMSHDWVEAYFAAARVFCQASTVRAEAYGVSVLEAMARGLPVVTTRIPGSGLSWLARHGDNALKVPPGDPLALAQALRTVLDDPALGRRLGEAGRQRWATELTAQQMGERTLSIYVALVGRSPTPLGTRTLDSTCEDPA